MEKLIQIAYDKDKKTLNVGAGVIWDDVYKYLATVAPGRMLGVVGRDPLVGVFGWLLGGDSSLLTSKYGLSIDNVVEFQVGARDVLNVNREKSSELFKALKVLSSTIII